MAVSAYSAASQDQAVAQINITPLVDVMLVLLVIFMVSAPILTAPITTALPQSDRTDRPSPPRLRLQVSAAGEFFLDGQLLPADALTDALTRVRVDAPQTVLEIDASGDGDYQSFATALAAARHSGLQNIALPR